MTRVAIDLDSLAATLAASPPRGSRSSSSLAWGETIRPSPEALASALAQDTLPLVDVRPVDAAGESADLELVRVLGEGGMGAVWLAHQRSLRREVAIKMPRDVALGREALVWEARLAGSLEHPSVVPTYALGRDDRGRPVLVMKRVEGVTLGELLEQPGHARWAALEKRSGDRLGVIVDVLSRVSDALEFAHARAIIHRDIKPDNVMIGSFGEVYLLDWGVAFEKGSAPASVVGTPAFIAPEMLEGVADERTDVFLLGATLHVALTGRPRHEGQSLADVLRSALACAPYRYDETVPSELAALGNDATARDPAARPPSALAFRERLGEFLRHRTLDQLVADVEQRVGAARADGELHALAEARFALASVLREWPLFKRGRDLHARILERIVRLEVASGRADEAAAALAELPDAAPELQALVERARGAAHAAHEAARFGREERREVAVAPTYRGMVFLVTLMGLVAVVMLGAIHLSGPLTMWRIFLIDLVGISVMGTAAFIRRRSILSNRRGRATVTGVFFYFACGSLMDLFSALQGIPVETASAFSLVAASMGIGGCTLMIPGATARMRLALGGASINALVLGFLAIAFPNAAPALVGVATLITLGVAIYWLREMAEDVSRGDVHSLVG